MKRYSCTSFIVLEGFTECVESTVPAKNEEQAKKVFIDYVLDHNGTLPHAKIIVTEI